LPRLFQLDESSARGGAFEDRKLGDNGTTFRKIVDEARHAQALAHFSMPQGVSPAELALA
jgi:hypothetical protein